MAVDAKIVDDQAQLTAGQMPRVQFLNQLHAQVVATANEALGPVWSAVGCPYIESWFNRNASTPAADLDRMARRYSGIASPQAAADYFPPILARLRDGIARWQAGEDVGREVAAAGGPGIAAAGAGGTTPAVAQPQTPEGAGAVQMKSAGAGGAEPGSPGAVLAELGPGSAIDAGHASRLGGAMDDSFGDVRIHTDGSAARKASEFGARAFTVGSHVAFAPGEYRPGTPEGDALLAHELAHVQQQRGAADTPALKKRGDEPASGEAHEADADSAAAGALARLYGAGVGLAKGARSVAGVAIDRSRAAATSGLALKRCDLFSNNDKKPDAAAPAKVVPAVTDQQLGSSVAKGLEQTNTGHSADKGVWYRHGFEAKYPDKFKPEWAEGYSVVEGSLMQRGKLPFMWLLKPGASASAAVKGWLTGLTIGDCASAACAAMLDSVRQAVGDEKFDAYFKLDKIDGTTKPEQVMMISQSTFGRLDTLTRQIDATKSPGTKNNRPVKKGDWHYFANHKDYPLKHPDGLFSGENAICLEDAPGKQKWAGRGVASTDEDVMIKELADAYNQNRTPTEDSMIAKTSGDEPKKYKLKSQGGTVADTIKEADVPGLTMQGEALDAAKVNAAFGLK